MGYRQFKDSHGIEWQLWDVVPHLVDRRVEDRRVHAASSVVIERRKVNTRRLQAGPRPMFNDVLDGGWLCFQADTEKRRLSPIPRDWERCAQPALERYCWAATPARRLTPDPGALSEMKEAV